MADESNTVAGEYSGPYHLRPDVLEQHRAIGYFITSFSELFHQMKSSMHGFLRPGDEFAHMDDPLLHALTGPLTADPIRSGFFGMCAAIGDYDDADRAVAKALQALVQRAIELRNQVAHADWTLGWAVHDTGEPIDPAAHKVRIGKSGVSNERIALDAAFLDLEARRMEYLRQVVGVFAASCSARRDGAGDRPSARLRTQRRGANGVAMVLLVEDEK